MDRGIKEVRLGGSERSSGATCSDHQSLHPVAPTPGIKALEESRGTFREKFLWQGPGRSPERTRRLSFF